MTTDPYVLQQLVKNHRRDLVDVAQEARLRKDLAVSPRRARRPVAWRGWLRHPTAVRPATAR